MQSIFACAAFLAVTTPLWSQDLVFKSSPAPSALIELYSSEGCSSCPPAEEWLNGLKNESGLWKDIFPVGFHVDYWDNLGWPDRFASPDYTRRQRTYAEHLAQDSVYTPEFIVNGKEWQRGGSVPRTSSGAGTLTVMVNDKESRISATYTSGLSSRLKQNLILNVALLGFDIPTDVKAGENSGRRLIHDFVVLGFSSSPLTARADGTFSAPVAVKSSTGDNPGALVAWVSADDGSILQVTGGWLPSAKAEASR